MSDDIQGQPLGEALTADDIIDLFPLDEQSIDDAIDWWDEFASGNFVGVLE